jgi:nitrite reductase/ring-hydroxylating ferredoxin subunit/uncharacterized membrane protein
MRSRASFRGHPIHPALIPFPLAFFYGAFVADLAGLLLARPALWTTGGVLAAAGVVMGLVAAIPGTIDYLHTVPPRSTGRDRAQKHALVNVGAVVLFAAAWLLRPADFWPPGLLVLGLEAVGVVLVTMGGWMGGTLVNRNQIGVDHRYAGAGKWREERLSRRSGDAWVAARSDELELNQMKLLHLDGHRVVLGRTEEGYVAFDDRCTHRGASLAGGVMICGTVQCPWHGSQFDCRTGEVRAGPAEKPIAVYEVTEVEGRVEIRWDAVSRV